MNVIITPDMNTIYTHTHKHTHTYIYHIHICEIITFEESANKKCMAFEIILNAVVVVVVVFISHHLNMHLLR